jgi:hypothetical protein
VDVSIHSSHSIKPVWFHCSGCSTDLFINCLLILWFLDALFIDITESGLGRGVILQN